MKKKKKTVTKAQLDELKHLRNHLTPQLSIDNKINTLIQISQVLRTINLTSTFSSNISTEFTGLEVFGERYNNFPKITSVIDDAIVYYDEQLNSFSQSS
ncbi:MAG: hypothetical protein K0R36_216 [Chryseobacterium sp.]|jgi:hypothetical protein|uniref:hypothetical protein n=1 Tax=Chryseobacterium sp. TaxID=1871047 RepID=UPI002629171D|nr:hypothetical protein [Chryseobacterium sp.]MDF2552342.1 hypothetical protein [Chryseobacterium sp.]MDF2930885.1 hypothetical protein [Chryseobacterium sp.]